jgi:hypothetical protein
MEINICLLVGLQFFIGQPVLGWYNRHWPIGMQWNALAPASHYKMSIMSVGLQWNSLIPANWFKMGTISMFPAGWLVQDGYIEHWPSGNRWNEICVSRLVCNGHFFYQPAGTRWVQYMSADWSVMKLHLTSQSVQGGCNNCVLAGWSAVIIFVTSQPILGGYNICRPICLQ